VSRGARCGLSIYLVAPKGAAGAVTGRCSWTSRYRDPARVLHSGGELRLAPIVGGLERVRDAFARQLVSGDPTTASAATRSRGAVTTVLLAVGSRAVRARRKQLVDCGLVIRLW
jgi:hypothetical protein